MNQQIWWENVAPKVNEITWRAEAPRCEEMVNILGDKGRKNVIIMKETAQKYIAMIDDIAIIISYPSDENKALNARKTGYTIRARLHFLIFWFIPQ